MSLEEIRYHINKRYRIGQVVNMRQRNEATGTIMKRFKAQIVKKYTYHIDCIVNGHHESFTYWDMMMLTRVGGSK